MSLREVKTILEAHDANVGSILGRLADLVVSLKWESEAQKMSLIKSIRDIELRLSVGMNDDFLLNHLIAAFFIVRSK